jgi:hypothetical protein
MELARLSTWALRAVHAAAALGDMNAGAGIGHKHPKTGIAFMAKAERLFAKAHTVSNQALVDMLDVSEALQRRHCCHEALCSGGMCRMPALTDAAECTQVRKGHLQSEVTPGATDAACSHQCAAAELLKDLAEHIPGKDSPR